MNYFLYPPFLVVPEDRDFADAWEAFCCKLLCLSERTTSIYRRHAPEKGVDLFYPDKGVAYQCKSVESGRSGDFNLAHCIASIKSAKEAQTALGWKTYAICTNVDLTGNTEAKLREELPEILLYPQSFWQTICERHPIEVETNFRRLVEIPRKRISEILNEPSVDHYPDTLRAMLDREQFEVFIYSNRYDKVFRMMVSPDFTVKDLIDILRKLFHLPESRTFSDERITASLAHSIVIDGTKRPLDSTLRSAKIAPGTVITYWVTIIWKDKSGELRGDILYYMTAKMMEDFLDSKKKNKDMAIKLFSKDIQQAFDEFCATL